MRQESDDEPRSALVSQPEVDYGVRHRCETRGRAVPPPAGTAPAGTATAALGGAGLGGGLITPAGAGPWPAVIVLPGSAGGVPEDLARRLARGGLAALALAYFGAPSLTRTLVEGRSSTCSGRRSGCARAST